MIVRIALHLVVMEFFHPMVLAHRHRFLRPIPRLRDCFGLEPFVFSDSCQNIKKFVTSVQTKGNCVPQFVSNITITSILVTTGTFLIFFLVQIGIFESSCESQLSWSLSFHIFLCLLFRVSSDHVIPCPVNKLLDEQRDVATHSASKLVRLMILFVTHFWEIKNE